ncbi:MATE family efflux transporter [Clostridium gasigenes]|uniref:Multidrug export protein MepA n=1 Tax=Clostridium gasigenes TaxID=94869 RepID=A0A1H0N1G0_9CLOT|nr:MATE family efflux transporter [Clostridium gasigenes]MBB6625208.1 MATE family efflux transporter [Clostridium gasigenes]MBU3087400.1 MATE family efflux transporter [Clostridium gasigenes]NKF05363.1 MATE family efflux transporter [Clostridium gasigenes]QSW18813.1 MATE family efflux transporter [Clostridium gasigenes]SDO86538.1 putative efflux protein, MATE family [Clostridium gasigenes]
MNKQDYLGEAPIYKLLIKYSIPAIIGMMVNALYNVVDRMFIGRIPDIGKLAMAGLGVTMPIVTIMLAFGMLVGIGTAANISIKLGQGNREDAEKIIGNALTLGVVIGIGITAIGIIFGGKLLLLFGASESTLPFAKAYINIILLGSIFNIVSFALNSSIRSDGNPKKSAIIMVVGCLVNIILDALFIFVFGFGIEGAAFATIISQAITAIWTVLYYTKGSSNLKLKKENLKLDKRLVKMIFAIGSAPFAMQLASSLVQVIANNTLKTYGGDLAIGAMATISAISMMFLMPIFGINQGAQPIIGYNYGAKKYDRANKTYLLSMGVAMVVLVVGFIIIQIFPRAILGLFNKDEELMKITIIGVRIYLSMLPIVAISITGSNYFQSIGSVKKAMFLSLLRQIILLMPLLIILPKWIGLKGVWLAQPVSDVLAVSITLVFLINEFKKHKSGISQILNS